MNAKTAENPVISRVSNRFPPLLKPLFWYEKYEKYEIFLGSQTPLFKRVLNLSPLRFLPFGSEIDNAHTERTANGIDNQIGNGRVAA